MGTDNLRRRLDALEIKYLEKPFTLFIYRMSNGEEKTTRKPKERKALEAQGGKLESFDIHIPDRHAEGGYRHIIWGRRGK